MKTNTMFEIVRVTCALGDVDAVVEKVEKKLGELKEKNVRITKAEIAQQLRHIPQDPKARAFYPLVLTATDNTVIMVSEVRCGYRGHSSDAMVKVLQMAGFNLGQHLVETIYNEPNIELTLYNE